MSDALIVGLIGAATTIAAALIGRFRLPRKTPKVIDWPRADDLFLLGANVAKIVWGKSGWIADKGIIQVVTPALYDRIGISQAVRAEFERLLSRTIPEESSSEAALHAMELFGVYVSTAFGNPKGRIFALGFRTINLLPLTDASSLQTSGTASICPMIEELITAVSEHGYPTAEYEEALLLARGGHEGWEDPVVLRLREKLVSAGSNLHRHLAEEASKSELDVVRQMQLISNRGL